MVGGGWLSLRWWVVVDVVVGGCWLVVGAGCWVLDDWWWVWVVGAGVVGGKKKRRRHFCDSSTFETFKFLQ